MATSEAAICNSALIKIGSTPIASLTESTKQAELCAHQYPIKRDALLSSHPWNFALTQVQLAQDVTAPEYGWAYRFTLPAGVLRVIWIGQGTLEVDDADWQKKGGYIYTDLSTLEIEYIQSISDVQMFPDYFAEALAWDLAHDICYALTGNGSLWEQVEKKRLKAIQEARSFDAQEGYPRVWKASDWTDEHRS